MTLVPLVPIGSPLSLAAEDHRPVRHLQHVGHVRGRGRVEDRDRPAVVEHVEDRRDQHAGAERDRLARIIDNPGDYTQTWKPTYNELVGIAHAQTVTVTVPSATIRDHLRARLDADRAGGSDV